MGYETLTFEVTDGVALITLNRPDAANALDKTMAGDLFDVAVRCDCDAAIRAAVLTANGDMFCAGGDLKSFNSKGEALPQFLTETATMLHNAMIRFQYMDAPLTVAVNGTAAGAGFSIALSGDHVIAAEGAKFVSAYTASGLTPDGSSTYFVAKHVGLLRAKELVLTNRVLSAEEACAWGLVNKVVPPEALMEEAMAVAGRFAKGPTKALGGAKRLLLTAYSASLESQLEAETQSISGMARTHDGVHGIKSFVAKEKPGFRGE
ncbi:MAG: enoyl-CoA hydratase/isomerase family protein [Hyphomicrobiales bacterium]